MSDNKLMEAAADILSGSKKAAPSMPPQKLAGDTEDLGGPTPQNSKPTDDSNKIHADKGSKDTSAHNQGSIKMKPSAASGKVLDSLKKEETEEESDEVSFVEDINAIFDGNDTISEEFKSKAATIFEARVFDQVKQIEESLLEEYNIALEEAVSEIQDELTEKVDQYLSYVVEQWMEENQIAIESGIRAELAEEFMAGLRNLFVEHYIDVPEEKVDLVDELAEKVVELEAKLDEEIQRNIEYKSALTESVKREIVHTVCEGLTDTQVEKIKSLAEGVEFSTEEEYTEKLETIRENYFPSGVKKAEENQLHETVEVDEDKPKAFDPFVAAVSQAISKTKL